MLIDNSFFSWKEMNIEFEKFNFVEDMIMIKNVKWKLKTEDQSISPFLTVMNFPINTTV